MAVNLGAAYVDIVPSTRGLGQSLRQQVVAPVSAAGGTAGEGFGSRFAASVGRFVAGVGETIEKVLSGAAIAGAGLVTAALTKGWSRLTTIQDATGALTISLGDAAAAGRLLDEVMEVVTGTPYNFDEFAAAAQRMAGFGVEAEKIPHYLTAIGEAAATQGKSANEFASRLTTVFSQVAASGQMSLADVWRISDTGVNALAILGNHFGKTTDEMKKMISKGAVPAGEALDALAKGILEGSDGPAGATVALAGTMEVLRGSLTGLVGAISPALGRIGANFLTPLTGPMVKALQSTLKILKEFEGDATRLGERLAESEGLQRFLGWLERIPDAIPKVSAGLRDLNGLLGPLLGAMAGFASKGLSGLPLIGSFIPAIGPIAGAFAGLVAQSPELRDSLMRLLEAFARLAGALGELFVPVIEKVVEVLEKVGGGVIDGLATAVGYVADLVETFNTSGIGGVWDKVSEDWSKAGPVLTGGLDTAWSAVSSWISTKAEELPGLVGGWADGFTSWIGEAINGGPSTGGKGLPDKLAEAYNVAAEWIENEGPNLGAKIRSEWPSAFGSWIDSFINGDGNTPGLNRRMQDIVDRIDAWIDSGGIERMVAAGARLFAGLVSGFVMYVVPGTARMFWSLLEAFLEWVQNMAWMFVQLGVSIAQRIVDGIVKGIRGELSSAVQGAIDGALGNVPGLGGVWRGGRAAWDAFDFLRADGGPVSAFSPYIVGERGPELFVPNHSGTVIPNHDLAPVRPSDRDSWTGGRDVVVYANYPGASASEIGHEVAWQLLVNA